MPPQRRTPKNNRTPQKTLEDFFRPAFQAEGRVRLAKKKKLFLRSDGEDWNIPTSRPKERETIEPRTVPPDSDVLKGLAMGPMPRDDQIGKVVASE
ncbi:hypothetical protein V5O48_011505 [Marasmius crinis-equi]|uniref:Uncharacterized protein n=1 Tax=Marasmius crinis-equi TaxID=585013 RepID=A0ABR3F5C9_9AGAR